MKRIINKMLRMALKTSTAIAKPSQGAIDEKISENLRLWIDSKAFCRQNETIPKVAEQLGVSPESLSYYCTHVLGEHFSTFRKKLRMEEAKSLIRKNPDAPIADIAVSVGIPDKANFRRQFYECFGFPPSEWRKRCKVLRMMHL